MEQEQIIMQLISQGGSARSESIAAIRKARSQDYQASEELLKKRMMTYLRRITYKLNYCKKKLMAVQKGLPY